MANEKVLNALYNRKPTPLEIYFDRLMAPPILSLVTIQDISELNRIAKSIKYTIDEKYKMIDSIMKYRGFVKLHAGTNRVVYRFLEDQSFVMKIAIDRVGMNDNPDEYRNQFLLKPFVTKVFEISPCGTVGLFERVEPIMSREEFLSVADDIFDLITKFFVGKYVLEDFGTKYFMNWAVRRGWGPVLLDFPYLFELDGDKLYCNAPVIPGTKFPVCGGEIDYDDGFNNLVCTKCGRPYHAKDLRKADDNKLIIVGGRKKMRVVVRRGNEILKDNGVEVAKVIEQPTVVKPRTSKVHIRGLEDRKISKPEVVKEVKAEQALPKKQITDMRVRISGLEDRIRKQKQEEEVIVEPEVIEQPQEEVVYEEELVLNKKDDDIFNETDESVINKVENRVEPEKITVVDDNAPTDAIFNKTKDEPKSMFSKLDDAIKDYNNIDEDDEDYSEYDDYDRFLNNRQRSNKVKRNTRKGNIDFSNF